MYSALAACSRPTVKRAPEFMIRFRFDCNALGAYRRAAAGATGDDRRLRGLAVRRGDRLHRTGDSRPSAQSGVVRAIRSAGSRPCTCI